MIDALDTLYNHFRTRMQTINASRVLKGYMDAQQWPPPNVEFDAFYLLSLGDMPIDGQSIGDPIYTHTVQFTWLNQGSDVNSANDVLGANRGNRVRTNWQMKQELLQALWPFFDQKQELSAAANGSLSFDTLNEPMKWTKPEFTLRSDKASGILYQVATVKITEITAEILV